MISIPPEPSDDEILMDRLIEGELDGPARRALLLRLDAQPEGWRRLALGFLEAQAWRESLGSLAGELLRPGEEPRRPPARRSFARSWLARAAVLLAVFGLGWGAGRSDGLPGSPSRDAVVHSEVPAPGDSQPGRAKTATVPAPIPDPLPQGSEAEERPDRTLVHEPAPGEAPYRSLGGAAAFLVSEAGRDRLQRRGYEVERRPAVAAVRLGDGRRAVIPIEDVKVRYVGARVY
jgi:hypothetical protein